LPMVISLFWMSATTGHTRMRKDPELQHTDSHDVQPRLPGGSSL
jgi:hypothetical protein